MARVVDGGGERDEDNPRTRRWPHSGQARGPPILFRYVQKSWPCEILKKNVTRLTRSSQMKCTKSQDIVEEKVCQEWSFETIMSVIPQHRIMSVLDETDSWEKRERKLNLLFVIQLVIALSLFPTHAVEELVEEVTAALRHQQRGPLALPSE